MAFNRFPKTTTRYIDTFEYESVNESGNTVKIDMHDPENKKAQSPTELLLTALASCSAVDVVVILQKRKKEFTDFKIETSGTRREEHPRAFTHINMKFILTSEDVKQEELLKHAKMVVEKYCSVATTIAKGVEISVEAEVL